MVPGVFELDMSGKARAVHQLLHSAMLLASDGLPE
jgi:hypothetical protein